VNVVCVNHVYDHCDYVFFSKTVGKKNRIGKGLTKWSIFLHSAVTLIKFPLKRKGCQVVVSVFIVLWDIWELLLMIVTIGTQ